MNIDKEAFEKQLLALVDAMYCVASSILPRQCDREDAIQETILTALQKRDHLREDKALRAWVMRILVNICYDMLREQKRERTTDVIPESENTWESPPDADLMLRDMLLSLSEEHRLLLVLFYVEGYKMREIAEILHLPMGTVQSRMHRAKQSLARDIVLEREGEE